MCQSNPETNIVSRVGAGNVVVVEVGQAGDVEPFEVARVERRGATARRRR